MLTDGDVNADAGLPPADRAVKYVLDRVQRDANLRHYLLHTEAMRLLCEAEAARLGEAAGGVEERREIWLGRTPCLPEVARLRRLLDEHGIDH